MTPHEARLAASTARTCLSATGGYGPWNSSDHACWVRAPNLGNGSSELMYQPPHCSLPVVGAASHGTARGHIRFVGDSVSMQHARSFACFREPQCGTTVDGWGVVVQGVCAQPGRDANAWLSDASRMLHGVRLADGATPRYDNSTIVQLLQFMRTHAGIRETEFCTCTSVSRLRLNEAPPAALIDPLMYLLLRLGREDGSPLGADPADAIVLNFGLWGKRGTQASHSSRSVAPLVRWWAARLHNDSREDGHRLAATAHHTRLPLLVYRETSPQHWLASASGYDASLQQSFLGKRCVAASNAAGTMREPMAADCAFVRAAADDGSRAAGGSGSAASTIIDDIHVALLPVFRPASARDDEHPVQKFYRLSPMKTPPRPPHMPDCTHFCQGGAMYRFWNGALLAVVRGAAERRRRLSSTSTAVLAPDGAVADPQLRQMLEKACPA